MFKVNNRSIVNQVVLTLVATVTLILGVVGVVGYKVYSHQQYNELHNKAKLGAEQLSTGIALAVWNFDALQIHKIMESTLQDRSVYGLAVETDNKIYTLARDSQDQLQQVDNNTLAQSALISEKHDINYSEQTIGRVKYYVTPRYTEKNLAQFRVILLAAIVLLDIVLILSLYNLIWRRVLSPLKLIENYATSVSSGQRKKAVTITQPLVGEFAELRNALEKMVNLLESQLEDLTLSNDRFWKLVTSFPLPLSLYIAESGKITFINQKFTQLFGYTLADIPDVDTWFHKAYPDAAYRDEIASSWTEMAELSLENKNEIITLPYVVQCKDGSKKTVEIGGLPSGEVVMGIFNDVTEARRAEAEIWAYQDHLKEQVELRTHELVIERDRAEAANRAKSVFLANMSHELRTPLNSIIGFSAMLSKDNKLEIPQKHNLEIINRSGLHLLTLINDILELSKIEAGKMELLAEPVDLRKMLNDIIEMLRPRAEQSGLGLFLEADEILPCLMVDSAKLRQVLLNLLANAVKFTPQGEVRLSVSNISRDDKAHIEFKITDTGIGIQSADQARIFEPFIQVEGSDKRAGTGLGLSISREYIRMMGGQLALTSEYGQGTSFYFTLNLPICDIPLESKEQDNGKILGLADNSARPRILIADDIPEMRILLRGLLEQVDLKVEEATDGIEARDYILSHHPQLVLMDWRMPNMDGIDLTREIRQHNEIAQPKIIMLTANAFDEDRRAAMEAGVDDFMGKPIDAEILYRLIEQHSDICFQREQTYNDTEHRIMPNISEEDVDNLSRAAYEMFTNALRELNPNKIADAIENIRHENSDLASRIMVYTEAMNYKKLWQVFGITYE